MPAPHELFVLARTLLFLASVDHLKREAEPSPGPWDAGVWEREGYMK